MTDQTSVTPENPAGTPPLAPSTKKSIGIFRRFLAGVILLCVLLISALAFSPLGLKILVALANQTLPGLTIEGVHGTIFSEVVVNRMTWVTPEQEVHLERLALELKPSCALQRRICIERLALENAEWKVIKSSEGPEFDFPAIERPHILLPFNVTLGAATLDQLSISLPESTPFRITNASIGMHTDHQTLFIGSATASIEFSDLSIHNRLEGNLDLRGNFPVKLETGVLLDFHGATRNLDIKADIQGPALNPSVTANTSGLVDAKVNADFSLLKKGWPVVARAHQTGFVELVSEDPLIRLSQSDAVITGFVNAYHVEGRTRLDGVPYTPAMNIDVITDGGFYGLQNGHLHATLDTPPDSQKPAQEAWYDGSFDWYPLLAWDGHFRALHADLSTWINDVDTDLQGTFDAKGHWYPDEPYVNDIFNVQASGAWRKQPVTLAGGMALRDETWFFENARLHLAKNSVVIDGSIGKTLSLDAAINLPKMSDILPILNGEITGHLKAAGTLESPQISGHASSKHLQVDDIAIDDLAAKIEGGEQHRLTASGKYKGYALSAGAIGSYHNAVWAGSLTTLQIQHADKQFSLEKPVPVKFDQNRLQLRHEQACLRAADEKVCVRSENDFIDMNSDVQVSAQAFQPVFFAPFLDMIQGDAGAISGRLDLQVKKNQLSVLDADFAVSDVKLKRVMKQHFKPAFDASKVTFQTKLKGQELLVDGDIQWNTLPPDKAVEGQKRSRIKARFPRFKHLDTLDLEVETDELPARWASRWVPLVKITGGSISGSVSGHIADGWPDLSGQLSATHAALTQRKGDFALYDADARLDFKGNEAFFSAQAKDNRDNHWHFGKPLHVKFRQDQRRTLLKSGCLNSGDNRDIREGKICAHGHYQADGDFVMKSHASGNISPWLAPVFSDNSLIDGPFDGTLTLQRNSGALAGNFEIRGTLRSLAGSSREEQSANVHTILGGHLADDRLDMTLTAKGERQGEASGHLQAEISGSQALEGNVTLKDIPLEPLTPYFPELSQLEGNLHGGFSMAGTLKNPELRGDLRIDDGKVSSVSWPLTIRHFDANAMLSEHEARLTANLSTGKGKGILLSRADWSGGQVVSDSKLTLRDFPIEQGSDINLRVDTDLTLKSSQDALDLGGLIRINEGFLRINKLPASATRISPDVIYVDQRGEQDDDKMLNAHVNMAVELNEMVQLEGMSAQVRMRGAVGIQQSPHSDPEGHGSLTITEGTYTGYGQALQVKKGQILFNGPLDNPVLAITAVRKIDAALETDRIEAGIQLNGTLQQPESTLFATRAGLSDQDILTYIVTGHAPTDSTFDNRTAVNQALVSVGLSGSEGFARDVASKAGIQDFEISTSSTVSRDPTQVAQSSVNVGGYLSPRLYLQYGVGLNTPVNTLTLRYRLTRNVFLEAISGLQNALNILYSFEVE